MYRNGLLFLILADFRKTRQKVNEKWKTLYEWQKIRGKKKMKLIKRKQCDIMKNVSRENDYLYRNYAVSRQPIYLQSVAIFEATWDAPARDNFRICFSFSLRFLILLFCSGRYDFHFCLLSYTDERKMKENNSIKKVSLWAKDCFEWQQQQWLSHHFSHLIVWYGGIYIVCMSYGWILIWFLFMCEYRTGIFFLLYLNISIRQVARA